MTVATAADVPVHVKVDRLAWNRVRVTGTTVVAGDPAIVWSVLTDYDHLADFIPGLRECRLVRTAPTTQLFQRGIIEWLMFRRRADVLFEVKESPLQTLDFQAVGGDFLEYRGRWHLEPIERDVKIHYEATLRPRFFLPPIIGARLLRRQLGDSLRAIASEVRRRAR